MRIRSIKPEFYRSEDIAALDWDTRLIFIGLWSYVDDNGVGRDVEQLIVADLFPLEDDPRETIARVSRGLQTLSERGLIIRYTVDSRPFLAISTWAKHQRIDRPNNARYPSPDQGILVDSRDPRDTLASLPVTVAPGTEEQGNRGTEEQGNRGTVTSAPAVLARAFDEAWTHWPKKVERKPAVEKFNVAARKFDDVTELVELIKTFGDAYAATTEKQFVPALGVWLGRERWTDELPQQRTAETRVTAAQRNLTTVEHFARLEQQTLEIGQ